MGQKNFSFITKENSYSEYLLDTQVYFTSIIEKAKVKRFLLLSAILHTLLATLVLTYSLTQIEKPKVETITIDLTTGTNAWGNPSLKDGSSLATNSNQIKPEQISSISEGSPSEVITKNDIVISKPKISKQQITKSKPLAKPTKAIVAKISKATKSARPVAVHPAISLPAQKSQPLYVPETLDDIQAPELAETRITPNNQENISDNELSNDFAKIDNKNSKVIQKLQNQFEADADQFQAEADADLKGLENQVSDEENRLNALSNNLKSQKEKLSTAVAAEKKAEEERRAKELAALEAQNARGNGHGGSGSGNGVGNGNGGNSATVGKLGSTIGTGKSGNADGSGKELGNGSQASGGFAGLPNGVRSLDQLRQMPGNPRPSYDYFERLRGHQGNVVFYAYITKEGSPVNFKLIKSTGHQNLDSKTLAALRKWKFYPGQEGWVELPFRWDLRGGPQEMPTLLRRVSQK